MHVPKKALSRKIKSEVSEISNELTEKPNLKSLVFFKTLKPN